MGEQAAAAIAMGRLGDPGAATALLAVPFSKPEPEGKPTATQLSALDDCSIASGMRWNSTATVNRPTAKAER